MGTLTRAVRNISRRKMRALLVIIALGFCMAIVISVPAGIVANQRATQSLSDMFNRTMSNMEAQINQTMTLVSCTNTSRSSSEPSPGNFNRSGFRFGGFGASGSFINESIVPDIASIPGVQNTVSELAVSESDGYTTQVSFFGRTFSMPVTKYTVEGVLLNSSLIDNYPILPTNVTAGRNLREGDSGVVLLSLNNTGFFGVDVNNTVSILGSVFKVVGVYNPATTFGAANSTLYMSLSDAQRITNNTNKMSTLDVYADNSSIAESIKTEIQTVYPDIQAQDWVDRQNILQSTETQANDTLKNDESIVSQEQNVATQEIIIAVVATSLIVLFVMLYTVRERTREIGTLKAIGFSNWNVMSQFMLEGMLLSLGAGIVGIAIGSVGAPLLTSILLPPLNNLNLFGGSSRGSFRPGSQSLGGTGIFGAATAASTHITLNPQLMLLALGAVVLLGALGSMYPAWRASRTSPMEALRYE
jgi:ABC-type antimicrobial peptide transport system permease subunit